MTSQQLEQRLRTGEQMIEIEADTNRRMELEVYWLRLLHDYERTTYTSPTSMVPRTEYHVLHLQPTAPLELVEAAFKCLSKLNHPDRGGDHEQMQVINEAVSIIRRRVAS